MSMSETDKAKATADAAGRNQRIVMPERYSIDVYSNDDVQKVVEANKLDCEYIDPLLPEYLFPANLLVEGSKVVNWEEADKDYSVNEWLNAIKA
jgi:hypothetical protein